MLDKHYISEQRRMLSVQRLSGKPKLRSYNLVEHSFFVTSLFYEVCKNRGIDVSSEELINIMNHDFLEVYTGDLIYTAKNLNEHVKSLWDSIEEEIVNSLPDAIRNIGDSYITKKFSDIKFKIFKACDLFELWLFLKEEIIDFGNKNKDIIAVFNKARELIILLDIYEINMVIEEEERV